MSAPLTVKSEVISEKIINYGENKGLTLKGLNKTI